MAVRLIFENKPDLKITPNELRELFVFCTSKNNFIFNGVIYDQIDGIAMGSPLAPTLANLFMGVNELKWLTGYSGMGPQFYRRYVDDIFAVFENRKEALLFLNYLNDQHNNIKFTKEENVDGGLAFLDISICNLNGVSTSVYHKSTYTGLLTNFKSFAPCNYKKRLIVTLLDRTFKITSSWKIFDLDVKALKKCLMRNLYPAPYIDRVIKNFLDKKISKVTEKDSPESVPNTRYITLPYIGEYSKKAEIKIRKMIKAFCKENVQIKLVFTICKVKSYLSTKDPLPKCFKSNVIYHFNCARCNSCYVGRTHIHYNTRCEQHLRSDKNSNVFRHLAQNNDCKDACGEKSFTILDNARTDYELALKEGMHIKWLKPVLNVQKKHEILKLLV